MFIEKKLRRYISWSQLLYNVKLSSEEIITYFNDFIKHSRTNISTLLRNQDIDEETFITIFPKLQPSEVFLFVSLNIDKVISDDLNVFLKLNGYAIDSVPFVLQLEEEDGLSLSKTVLINFKDITGNFISETKDKLVMVITKKSESTQYPEDQEIQVRFYKGLAKYRYYENDSDISSSEIVYDEKKELFEVWHFDETLVKKILSKCELTTNDRKDLIKIVTKELINEYLTLQNFVTHFNNMV